MPRPRIRSLGRGLWIVLIVILPVLGAVLWFLLGRAPAAPERVSRYRGPEDDPDFLGEQAPERPRTDKDQDDVTLRDLEDQFHDTDDDGRTDR